VGLLFVLQGLTGSFVAFLPEFDRLINPQITQHFDPRTAVPLPQIAENVWRARSGQYQGVGVGVINGERSITAAYWPIPDPRVRGGVDFMLARLDSQSGAILTEGRYGTLSRNRLDFTAYIHALHTTLTVGAIGRYTLIGAGIFLLLSVVVGFRIWWPGRSRLRQQLSPGSVKRSLWAQTVHRFVAPYAGILIALLVITGVALQFGLEIDPVYRQTSSPAAGRPQISPLKAWAAAEQAFPGAEPHDLGAPFFAGGVFRVILVPAVGKLAGEEIEVFIDNYSGKILRVRSSETASPLEKVLALLVPLHGGAILGLAGHMLAFVVGFMPLLLFVTGVRRWLETRAAQRKRPYRAKA